MKRIARLLSVGMLMLSFAGCGNQLSPTLSQKPKGYFTAKGGTPAKWTILVHMAADNNLYRYALENINEMEAGLSSDDINLLVLFDGQRRGDSRIYKVKHDSGVNDTLVSEAIADEGAVLPPESEIDSGDPEVLAKFVRWAAQNYPAQHTMLTIWNHGGGIFPNPATSKAFGWDDRGGNMETNDLSSSILPAFTGVAKRPLDILSFDACFMGQVEIGYQIKGLANYLVASEEGEPQGGWDYKAWLSNLSQNPGMDAAKLGSAIADSYANAYLPGGSRAEQGGIDGVTLSAVDLKALNEQLVPALDRFAGVCIPNMPAIKETLDKVRGWEAQSFNKSVCCDLGDFARAIQAAPLGAEVKEAAKAIEVALKKTVLANRHSKPTVRANGLSIYFPRSFDRYNALYDDPNAIAFANERWKDFLKATRAN